MFTSRPPVRAVQSVNGFFGSSERSRTFSFPASSSTRGSSLTGRGMRCSSSPIVSAAAPTTSANWSASTHTTALIPPKTV